MAKFPREMLTSELGEDGKWHARYPSATLTLCGLTASTVRAMRRRWPPDCGLCAKTSRRFDVIDGSAPDHWKKAA